MDYQDIILPDVPLPLLEKLEKIFPDRSPGETESLDQIRYKIGQVSVVRFLRRQYTRQTEVVLSKEKR